MKNILVTGGAGFIGSHLVEELSNTGYRVTVLDNLSTGNINNLSNTKIDLVQGDLSNHNLIDDTVKNIDGICHLAALPSVVQSIRDPISSSLQNTSDSIYLLYTAMQAGCKNFIFSSSASIYGDSNFRSEFNPLSPYAASKASIEMFSNSFKNCYDMNIISLRYFNVYGPRQSSSSPYSGVITKLMNCARNNTQFIVNGDGEQTRDFIYVKDVVKANILALNTFEKCDPMDIGSGESINLNCLISKVRELSNFPVKFGPPLLGDPRHSQSDIKKAKDQIRYEPSISLSEGLKFTYESM